MKKQTCLGDGGYGIPLLSVAAQLLGTGMLVVTAFLAVGQTQPQSNQQQPESFVAVVADAQGLPSVPADQRPSFGTYWKVRNSYPCVTAPLPFPPHDPSLVVYAVGGGQFLVDETAGQLVSLLPSPSGQTALSAADYASILQEQVDELQRFVAQIQAAQLNAQSSRNGQLSGLGLDSPPMSSEDGGDITFDGPIATMNDLWLQILSISVTNGTANLVIHPPWNVTNGVYELLYCTNLAPPISWQWLLRTDPGQTNLTAPNAAPAQGFYRLGPPDDLVATSSLGTNFWVAFPYMYDAAGQMSLYISSPVGATGSVTIPGLGITNTFSVAARTVTQVGISNVAMTNGMDVTASNAIHVTASQPVSVYGVYYQAQTSGAFTGYPTPLLRTNYCIIAYQPSGLYSKFAIVATADNTTVSITPSVTANLFGEPGFYQVVLMQGQTYQNGTTGWDYWNDVTGTWISSDKPIAVFAGANGTRVPDTMTLAGNPLVQEQLPVDTWGTQAVALSLAGRTNGDSYRILAAYSNTVVTISGRVVSPLDESSTPWTVTTSNEVVVVVITNAGQFYDIIVDGPVEFRASQPIQVAQFANGAASDHGVEPFEGDPCELLLPLTGHYLCTNVVYTLPNDGVTGGFDTNFLNIIVAQSAIGNTLLDSSILAASNFVVIGTSGYCGAQVPVTNGVHTVTSSQPVWVEAYGWGSWDAYGYFSGIVK
jgi:hypothetical protein